MWRYVGRGAYLPGVPARDLTEDEMEAAEAAEPGVQRSGLYRREKPGRQQEVTDGERD